MRLLARRNLFHVGKILGRKNIRTDEPSEHVDTKILETLVELDPGQWPPLGLRVTPTSKPVKGKRLSK